MAEKAPARISPAALEQQIASGRVQPVYLLLGPDDEAKSRLVARLAETIEEDLRAFNVDKVYPAEQRDEARKQFWNLMQLVRTLPLMSPRRVVVVAQAERLMPIFKHPEDEAPREPVDKSGRRGKKGVAKAAGEAELEALEQYLLSPSAETALVFVAGSDLKRNLRPVMLIEKHATVVDCDPLSDAGDAAAWVKAEAAKEGIRIEAGAVRLLARLAGDDITRLRAEFERALVFASGDGLITEAAVQEVASAPTTRDPWAMTNAIAAGDAKGALRELALKFDAGEMPVMILGQLAWFTRMKLAPARVARAVDAEFRTDLALKTSRGEPRILLERLVVELCGEGDRRKGS
ncbi:MAG: DNA polymerase III subunit delta [Acidobacteria bacterium]|nr:DNA polymerase III subunit delta [Acidobacteriota bacterium]